MLRKPTRRSFFSLTVLTLAACGGDGPSSPPVPVEVLVTPAYDTLTVTGGTLKLTAQVLGKKGKVLTGIPVTWSSSRPTVAEVGEMGLATAVGPGVTQIQATAGGVVGQASLTVALEPAQTEKVAGDGQTGSVGEV
ncbi:MAG: Ig-like domain-containing protein, partial [Gemmatimonadota bacterium]